MLHSFFVSSGIKIVFLWVPSHAGIARNEEVDWIAKLVTSNSIVPDSVIIKQSYLSNFVSKVEATIRSYRWELWNQLYQNSTTGQNYKQFFNSVFQSNNSSSAIFRLQTGHFRLNFHLKKQVFKTLDFVYSV